MRSVTREEMQELDRRAQTEFGIPAERLMENAGRAVADVVLRRTTGPIVVICGKGNNGGDGFVAARYLAPAGRAVSVYVPEEPEPDSLAYRNYAKILRLPSEFSQGVIVDAIFGTGLTRPVTGEWYRTIEAIHRRKTTVVSVDTPSGLDANTGQPLGISVVATITVTMGLPKVGFQGAEKYTGEVVIADIGYPPELLA